jgi:hypothetical protein
MQPHQQRVVDEKDELEIKYNALGVFVNSELFASLPDEERARMNKQYAIMGDYIDVLSERIDAF